MKAWILHGIGDLRLEEKERPKPGPGEVLIRVAAAGICGSDVPRTFDTGAHRMPLVLGHEFSGTAEELGEGVDPSLFGRRFCVFPLIPCKKCGPCKKKLYEMCRNYNYLGSRCDGGFAEWVNVPAENLLELPETVSLKAAAMMEPLAVSMHALRRGAVEAQDKVLVIGCGTIGLMISLLLKSRGNEPLVIGNKESQRKKCETFGIMNFCNSKEEDPKEWLDKRTEGEGAEVVFECVGKEETYRQAVAFASYGGRVVLVGNPASDMALPRDVYWKILRNQLRLTGTWNSSFTGEETDDWHKVLSLIEKKCFEPEKLVSHCLEMGGLLEGLHIMKEKKEDYTKIMIVPGGRDADISG